jgi:hypothetical protein
MRLLSVLALLAVAGAAPAADPTARPVAVNIVRPPTDIPGVTLTGASSTLGVVAFLPDRSVVCLDPGACKLAFSDDKTTDLTGGKPLALAPAVQYIGTNSLVQFPVTAPGLPVAGATKVRLKGDLVFLCGKGEKTATGGTVLKAKEKTTVGPAAFEVVQNGNALLIQVTADQPLIKSITFLDQDKKVGAGQLVLALGPDGKVVQKGQYVLPPNTQAVSISVTHFEKVEPVTVPIDAAMGIGP